MARELSSLELRHLVNEFDILKDAKINKIFHPQKKEFLFQLHLPNIGKKILNIKLPNLIYLSDEKGEFDQPSGFCMFLRKHLTNARIRSVMQKGFERIIEIRLETKDNAYFLIMELFLKGNLILCDKEYKMLAVEERQKWKQREVRTGMTYKFPIRKYDFFKITKKELKEMLVVSERGSLVKTLAVDLGLGGTYAEELCSVAGIDKRAVKADVDKIFSAVDKMRKRKAAPCAVYEGKKIIDFFPFKISKYSDYKTFKSLNEAVLNSLELFSHSVSEKKPYEKKLVKMKRLIQMQEQRLKEIEDKIKDNKRIGELIYEKYSVVENILNEIGKAKEKHSWEEIKKRLKGHSVVRKVDAKNKKIEIDL